MARPKSSQHELKRDEILDVAAQCFADRSYPAASMNDIAAAGGTSKARLYHYYESKEAILFDLLDRYTQRLLAVIGQVEATAQRRNLDDRAALHELVRSFLEEYEHSATRHVALLHDTKFLGDAQRDLILNRQRDVVSAVTRFLRRAYPVRVVAANQTPVAMMLFGMINWTFTWLRPGGPMSYTAFAEEVIAMLDMAGAMTRRCTWWSWALPAAASRRWASGSRRLLGLPLIEGDEFHPAAQHRKDAPGPAAGRPGPGRLAATPGAGTRPPPGRRGADLLGAQARYRDSLRAAAPRLRFVHLALSQEQALERVAARDGHFYPPSLVASQFEALEDPAAEAGVWSSTPACRWRRSRGGPSNWLAEQPHR